MHAIFPGDYFRTGKKNWFLDDSKVFLVRSSAPIAKVSFNLLKSMVFCGCQKSKSCFSPGSKKRNAVIGIT
jgi:hypothetical protein